MVTLLRADPAGHTARRRVSWRTAKCVPLAELRAGSWSSLKENGVDMSTPFIGNFSPAPSPHPPKLP